MLATLNLVREQINIFWMMRYTRTKEMVLVYDIISMGRRFNKTIYGVADKTYKDRVGKSVSLVREQIKIFWMMRYTRTKEVVLVYEMIFWWRRTP